MGVSAVPAPQKQFLIFTTLALLILGLGSTAAPAQELRYPTKTIRWIVNASPGAPLDIVARKLTPAMESKLGGTIIVENKAGASGTLGANEVAKAAPDGHTVLMTVGDALVGSIALMNPAPYDPTKDFKFVSKLLKGNPVLVANASYGPNTLQEMIAATKLADKTTSYGTWGHLTISHYTMEALAKQTGAKLTAVHYRSVPQVFQATVGNEVSMSFTGPTIAAPLISEGKLKPYAILGDKRVALLPDTPTFAEIGIEGLVFRGAIYMGVLVPARTPDAIVEKLANALKSTLADPATRQFIAALGSDVVASSPSEFTQEHKLEYRELTALIKGLGITEE